MLFWPKAPPVTRAVPLADHRPRVSIFAQDEEVEFQIQRALLAMSRSRRFDELVLVNETRAAALRLEIVVAAALQLTIFNDQWANMSAICPGGRSDLCRTARAKWKDVSLKWISAVPRNPKRVHPL